MPDRIFINVDLPAPFEPNNPRHYPSFKFNSTSSKTATPENVFLISFIDKIDLFIIILRPQVYIT